MASWVLAVCLLASATSVAHAGPEERRARKLYAEGLKAYGLGKFEEAAERYIEAFQAVPKPAFLFNAAQAYRLAGNPEKALEFYRSFLRLQPNAAILSEVERRINEMQTEIDQRAAKPPPDERVVVPAPDRVADRAVPIAEPPPAPAPAAPRDRPARPIYKRWWFWAGVGAVSVATVAIVVVSSSGDDSVPEANYGHEAIF